MPFLLGVDEAGYGPNLGPLLISASLWEVSEETRGDELYRLLQSVIRPLAAGAAKAADRRVVIADSKAIYQSGKGWNLLERGLWAAWGLIQERPANCGEVWKLLTGRDAGPRREALCDGCDSLPVPRDLDFEDIDRLRPRLCEALAEAGVRLAALSSVAVFPREFNDAVDRGESKGTALSRWTLQLVARMIEPLAHGPISVLCDKHGAARPLSSALGRGLSGPVHRGRP